MWGKIYQEIKKKVDMIQLTCFCIILAINNGLFMVLSLCETGKKTFIRPSFLLFGQVHAILVQLGLHATNPVFGISNKASFTPVSSATWTSQKIELWPVASLHMILSTKRIKKALIRLHGCAGWSAHVLFANPEDRFSRVVAHYYA